jgi:hypothetical protein
MATKKTGQVSAQVALRSASGKSFRDQPVTAANISEYLPAAETVNAAQARFQELGFEVANAFGNSFSITAPRGTFEKVFKVKLKHTDSGGVQAMSADAKEADYELPLDALPKDLKQNVEAATFSPPPDFGPTNY